ncbi:MAG: CRISPR-associated helicase Cas3' [Tractidigestivibacter sp.]
MPDKSDWQTLEDHLASVGELAAKFAAPFHASSWARTAGVLHDAGKACPEFQQRLEGKHPPIDHSIAGARLAAAYYPNDRINEGLPLAPIIAGHHTGLPDSGDLTARSEQDASVTSLEELEDRFADYKHLLPSESSDGRVATRPNTSRDSQEMYREATFNMFLLEHLLFSALVDADWIDTERMMSPENYRRRLEAHKHQLSLQELLERLEQHLARVTSSAPQSAVNSARTDMLNHARSMASLKPGIFSLEMPTGSGKTLTSLDFSLRHALSNGMRRVIYAIPFMSIVEQNAKIFKDVLGADNVLEHVSSYDYGFSANQDDESNERSLREKELTQNWDAPVVVTTNVQLFESLFSNRTAKSRKVHNIAGSVIVLDEVQSLPDRLLRPTLAMIEALVSMANVSVVLCTATQPRFQQCWPFTASVTQIIDNKAQHRDVFNGRATINVEHVGNGEGLALSELVEELMESKQSLCIVSSRKAAGMLYEALGDYQGDSEGLFHLSAMMVPEHRSLVIANIKQRLSERLPCHVVSTQLIEAGVDIDFPTVYREITGIDSILQAAGRCNREGKLGHPGRVVVFECPDFDANRPKKPGWLSRMRALGTETIQYFKDLGKDPFSDEGIDYFYERRYQSSGHVDDSLDGFQGRPIYGLITSQDYLKHHLANGAFPYKEISDSYKFINEETVSIFVPWGATGEALLQEIEARNSSDQALYQRIQRHSISVRMWEYKKYEEAGCIRRIGTFPVPVLETRNGARRLYDDNLGLLDVDEGVIETAII